MNEIFRKSALEKLSSPEQLDRTIVITSPLSWMAIIGVALIVIVFIAWAVTGSLPTTVEANGIIVNGKDAVTIHSAYSGELIENRMSIGQQIKDGDVVGIVKESGGAKTELIATQTGRITDISHNVGDTINKYDTIAKLTPDVDNKDVLITYLPVDTGKIIQKGMKAIVTPVSLDGQKYGHMEAAVVAVDDYVTSTEDIQALIGNDSKLTDLFLSDTPTVALILDLKKDSETKSGYYWSADKGKALDITAGTVAEIQIVTSESAPIAKLLPILDTEAE